MLFNKTIIPARGLVLVAPIEDPEKTPKGLLLPKGGKKSASNEDIERKGGLVAEVVAIGLPPLNDAGLEVPMDGLGVGDLVFVRSAFGSTLHILDGETFFLCPFGAIGGTVVPTEGAESTQPPPPTLVL